MHFLSPPTVRAQTQKLLSRHWWKRGHLLLLMAGLSAQLLSVLMTSTAPTSSTPTPQPKRAPRVPPVRSLSARRREGISAARARLISSKGCPPDASPRAAQRFTSFVPIRTPLCLALNLMLRGQSNRDRCRGCRVLSPWDSARIVVSRLSLMAIHPPSERSGS